MKQRVLTIILVFTVLLGTLTGCGGGTKTSDTTTDSSTATESSTTTETSTGKSIKIDLSMAARDQFLTSLEMAASDSAEKAGAEFTAYDAENDITKQLSHIQTAVTKGVDVMIVNIVDTDTAEEIISAAGDMKLVFVNRMVDETKLKDGQIVYVGSDEEEAGKLQGEYFAKYFKDQGKTEINVAILSGTVGMQAAVKRTDSAKAALESSGLKINYVFEDTADWDRAKALDKFSQFLGTKKEVDCVICNNDEMALGVIEAERASLGKITIPVAGIDATDVALESVKSGELEFTVYQNAIGQGEGSIAAALKLANGEKCDLLNMIPFEPVDKDNVTDYIK